MVPSRKGNFSLEVAADNCWSFSYNFFVLNLNHNFIWLCIAVTYVQLIRLRAK